MFSWVLKTSKDSGSITSLDSLFHSFIFLQVFFWFLIISNLNFSCFTLFSWSFVPTLCNAVKRLALSSPWLLCRYQQAVLHSHSKIFSFTALKKARPICLSSNGKCSGTQPSKIKEIRAVSPRDYFSCLFNSWVFMIF